MVTLEDGGLFQPQIIPSVCPGIQVSQGITTSLLVIMTLAIGLLPILRNLARTLLQLKDIRQAYLAIGRLPLVVITTLNISLLTCLRTALS